MYYTILLFLFSYELVNDKIIESKNVPTADVIRKMNWEKKHKFDLTKEWRDNLKAKKNSLITGLIKNHINIMIQVFS